MTQLEINQTITKIHYLDIIHPSRPIRMTGNAEARNKRSKFTVDEDAQLSELVAIHGDGDWNIIASGLPGRNTRQCRERWNHYLAPSVVTTPFTPEEDALLCAKYKIYGPKWKEIAPFFKGRTYITVKNRWLFLDRHHTAASLGRSITADRNTQSNLPLPVISCPAISRAAPDPIPWSDEEHFSDEDGDGVLFPESTDLSTDYLCVSFIS
jgi:hypothetical protein